jgi:hypothetical protein
MQSKGARNPAASAPIGPRARLYRAGRPTPSKATANRAAEAGGEPRLPSEARKLLPRGGGRPSDFFGFERAMRRVYCTELRASSFFQVQRAAPRGHLLSEVDPLYKKNGAHISLYIGPSSPLSPPPSFLPFPSPPFLYTSVALDLPALKLPKTALPSVAQNVKRSAGVSWSPRSAA